ncbi:Alkaline phosphatase, partial [hydrothermal vent metagenome]
SITSDNDGSITNANTTITFINFTNISGGDFNDDFVFAPTGVIRGQIDGGSGVNTIDYSALATVNVNVNPTAANGIVNINTIIGNNINSTINATVNPNTWSVTGNNDGTVNGIDFTNFNVLNGSGAVDTFNVSATGSMGNQVAPDTDLISGIYGLGGDDIFNVAFDGTNNGSIKINGGADNDSLTLTGGNANYSETYETNVAGGYDRLSYTQIPNNMAVNFIDVETVRDDVAVSQLTVNGTAGDDIVLLNASAGNNFQVAANTLVSYSGKDNLTIDTLGGTNDLIDILGDINLTGTLSLSSETVTNSTSSLISANTLVLNSVINAGILGTQIRTDVANLRLTAITGDVFIEEASDVDIGEMNTSGLFELRALTGNITDSGDLVSTGIVNLFADNGNIILDNNNQLSGELSFDAQVGNVTLVNGSTQLNTVTTQNLNIAANGDITDVATAVITTDSTTLSASGQNIVLDSATSVYNDITITDAANLTLIDSNVGGLIISNVAVANNADITSNGNLNINTISAGNTASLTTTGAILDRNDTDTNVTASLLQISSVTGIGEADSFETQVRTMDIVNTGSGFIDLVQTGVVDLVALQNLGVSGDIAFESDADINLNQNSVVANQNGTGVLFMNTLRGSYLGLGEADVTNPDITARNATFFGLAGTFGTFQRPITLDVPQDGSVLIATRASFDPQFAPPRPDDVVTQGIDFTALGAISAAAGEQLVAVESLGDIDPAIFTDLQNYSAEETSIRMPRDQLFEDELDERERF